MTTPTHLRVLVTGAGGFIGHHLVTFLKRQGYWVRGVDLTNEAMGNMTFGGMVFLLLKGRAPDANELRLTDTVLVSLVEHGLTPSAMIAR